MTNVPAPAGVDPPYPGPVIRHPADAESGGGWEQGPGGAPMLGVLVPEDSEATACAVRARIAHVRRATLAPLQIEL